jgi:hypothetical protein
MNGIDILTIARQQLSDAISNFQSRPAVNRHHDTGRQADVSGLRRVRRV